MLSELKRANLYRSSKFKLALASILVVAVATTSLVTYADAFGTLPWVVGSPMQSGDTYRFYLCDRGHQATLWGHEVANSDGCQNITLTFYGPFSDAGNAYWLIQAYGQHPAVPTQTESALLTLRISTLNVEPVLHYYSLAELLEDTIFYTGQYHRTNLNVGATWTSHTLPDMTVYAYSEGVYFSGYRDGTGRTNGMSFSPLSPLPLSADMPDDGFSFRMLT